MPLHDVSPGPQPIIHLVSGFTAGSTSAGTSTEASGVALATCAAVTVNGHQLLRLTFRGDHTNGSQTGFLAFQDNGSDLWVVNFYDPDLPSGFHTEGNSSLFWEFTPTAGSHVFRMWFWDNGGTDRHKMGNAQLTVDWIG